MEEIESQIAVAVAGRSFALRFWAINYGTHVGSTVKIIEGDAVLIELSFETHWNAAGRYILRIGGVKAHADFAAAGAVSALAGANVLKRYADIFSRASSLNDVFGHVKTHADALLWAAGSALAEPGMLA